MNFFTLEYSLILSFTLFAIGSYGVLSQRNLLVVLMSLEIMLNSVNLAFLSFNYFQYYLKGKEFGQYFVLLVIAVAAAEAAVGLAILVSIYRNRRRVDTNDLTEMKG